MATDDLRDPMSDADLRDVVGRMVEADLAWCEDTGDDVTSPGFFGYLARTAVAPVLAERDVSAEQTRIRLADALDLSHSLEMDTLLIMAAELMRAFKATATENSDLRRERNEAREYVVRLVLQAVGSWPGWGDEVRDAFNEADREIDRLLRTEKQLRAELERERESRQDWAVEAMRLDAELEQARHERNLAQQYVVHLVYAATGKWSGSAIEPVAPQVEAAIKAIRALGEELDELGAELDAVKAELEHARRALLVGIPRDVREAFTDAPLQRLAVEVSRLARQRDPYLPRLSVTEAAEQAPKKSPYRYAWPDTPCPECGCDACDHNPTEDLPAGPATPTEPRERITFTDHEDVVHVWDWDAVRWVVEDQAGGGS